MSNNGTLTTPVEHARAALGHARATRAQWMIAVSNGTATVRDILVCAATVEGKPLRRIKLRQVIGAQPGVGEHTAREQVRRIAASCNTENDKEHDLTVGWALDGRSSRSRQDAISSVVCMGEKQTWQGYPFSPAKPHPTRVANR